MEETDGQGIKGHEIEETGGREGEMEGTDGETEANGNEGCSLTKL